MNATRFRSMRMWIAVLASLWFVVQCASVVESQLVFAQQVETEEPQNTPWSDEAEGERSDADGSEDEEREDEVKVLIWGWKAADGLRSLAPHLHDLAVVPERAGHGLPPTPPPRRS